VVEQDLRKKHIRISHVVARDQKERRRIFVESECTQQALVLGKNVY
jgi:hypothetical protein